MAEQEEGFTFVDKRRVSEDAVVTEPENESASAVTEEPTPLPIDDAGAGEFEDDVTTDELGIGSTNQVALYAIGLLQMNALQHLGLMADPKTGKSSRDLKQAKVAIDCVAGLVAALDTPGSVLEPNLKQEMRRMITDLRLNYVTQTQMAGSDSK